MAVDFSRNAFELFAGRKRTRLLPTLVITVLVTAAVAIPLVIRALDSPDTTAQVVVAPADSQLVIVDTLDTNPGPLDTSTVAGPILISLREPDASAVSFNLYASGAEQAIVESLDLQGPQFDFAVDDSGSVTPFDSTILSNGAYDLFITIQTAESDRRTAVSFRVENP